MAVSPGFHSSGRPATSTLAVQPQPRVSSISGSSQVLQKPLSGCSSPQEGAKSSAGISQPVNISAPPQSLSRNLHIPASAQSTSRPVATVTAQPVALNRVGLELPHDASSNSPLICCCLPCPGNNCVLSTGGRSTEDSGPVGAPLWGFGNGEGPGRKCILPEWNP